MKAKDLKFPFKWENRAPLIREKVLYVPKNYQGHAQWAFPGWDAPDVFGSKAPVWIEYCSGNGAWIIEKAIAHPEMHWVAVEKRFERVQKIWSKMHNLQLHNLFIVCGEALTFTQHYVKDNSFEGAYINFPDPWPKAKHAKHRLLNEVFMSELSRVCGLEGKTTIVTDFADYAQQITQMALAHPLWANVFPDPYFITEWEGYGTSFFDELWRKRGKTIHYLQFSNAKGHEAVT